MGKAQNDFVRYFGNKEKYAALLNGYFFDGKEVIIPSGLEDKDPKTSLPAEYEKVTVKGKKTFFERDLIKSYKFDDGTEILFCLFGVEHLDYIDYSMPVRVMAYDANDLLVQVSTLETLTDKIHPITDKDYWKDKDIRSRLQPGQYLTPVITLIVYLGEEEWDGPTNVRDMFPKYPPEFEHLLTDYPMPLLSPKRLNTQELNQYDPETSAIFTIIKYQDDPDVLDRLIANNPIYKSFSAPAAGLISSAASYNMKNVSEKNKGGTYNMSSGFEKLFKMKEEKGAAEATIKANKKNKEENLQKNLETARNVMNETGLTAAKAVSLIAASDEDKKKLLEMLTS